jgi:glycosyltransferase involved in cell wall biosynthesis
MSADPDMVEHVSDKLTAANQEHEDTASPLASKRILIMTLNQVGRGTYRRASYFSRLLAQRGHQVTLMAVSPTARWRLRERIVDGVRLVETPEIFWGSLRSGWDPYDVLRRLLWLRQQDFDLVHAVESRPIVLIPALQAQRQGFPLVMDWCDWFGRGGSVEDRPNPILRAVLRPVETFLEERFRTRADGTLVIASFLRQRAIALGVEPETIRVIRDGADTAVQPENAQVARASLGLSLDAPLIGFLGSAYPRDAELMARAFNEVSRRLPTARLLLIGYFNRRIEEMLYNPGAIIRTGYISFDEMHRYLAACTVCWLPLCDTGTNRGRWPTKVTDYMAAGRPVVGTPVGELGVLIPQYNLGVVARAAPTDFATQTLELLADPDRCRQLGSNARRAAETDFSWERMTDHLEVFYGQVLTKFASARRNK